MPVGFLWADGRPNAGACKAGMVGRGLTLARAESKLEKVTSDNQGTKNTGLAWWLTRAPLVLSRHLWIWPLTGAIVLGTVGWWVHRQVENTTRAELASRLQTLVRADVAALRLWFSEQEADARSFALDLRIQGAMQELVQLSREKPAASSLVEAPAAKALQVHLMPLLEAQGYLDYVVVGTDRRIVASPHRYLVNRRTPPPYEMFLTTAFAGQLSVSRPFTAEPDPEQRSQGPTMFVAAPVTSTNGTVIAVLGLRMRPEQEFTKIFSVARMGESGESYAFDQTGMMLTRSRFEEELKAKGLIPNTPGSTAILNLRLFEPESGDTAKVGNSGKRGGRKPRLTRMASAALAGKSVDGCDVNGYRNYRGATVVGAWEWVPEFGMGVATEVGADEAFHTLYILRRTFMVLFALLVVSGAGIFGFTLLVERLQAKLRRSALAARRLGQYVLVQEIGRGASGMVYRARHALLRRPVAIKLLSPDMTDEHNAARFEQEVQMTSQLTHPNTVAIYDYGRTPEGLFYYAMEYLSGIDLDRLAREFGPQPEGRVIHILRQVCGSLSEAHKVGLIHRDVKPANILLTCRGSAFDVVKVLDFGLVKTAQRGGKEWSGAVMGTPHFMPPEAIKNPDAVDARSDLYSLGAVGYWLLTARTLFTSVAIEELLVNQVRNIPLTPSETLGRPVAKDLEALILQCLAKSPAERPESADALEEALALCGAANHWTRSDAARWWKDNLVVVSAQPAATMPEKTLVIEPRS
jgi:eukaryotic-like serine/threonine-protein kinase